MLKCKCKCTVPAIAHLHFQHFSRHSLSLWRCELGKAIHCQTEVWIMAPSLIPCQGNFSWSSNLGGNLGKSENTQWWWNAFFKRAFVCVVPRTICRFFSAPKAVAINHYVWNAKMQSLICLNLAAAKLLAATTATTARAHYLWQNTE